VRALPKIAAADPVRLACYGTLSPFEPVVGVRKVVGLSQVRRRSAVLFQVGAFLHWHPKALAALLSLPDAERASLSLRLQGAAAGLDELVGRAVTAGELRDTTHHLLAARLDVRPTRSAWTAAERAAAERIELERFRPLSQGEGLHA
jgi:lipoate-protein ligase A